MVTGPGPLVARAAAVIPAVLIVVFIGLLWLIGLFCGDKRRKYVTGITERAMEVIRVFFDGPRPPSQARYAYAAESPLPSMTASVHKSGTTIE